MFYSKINCSSGVSYYPEVPNDLSENKECSFEDIISDYSMTFKDLEIANIEFLKKMPLNQAKQFLKRMQDFPQLLETIQVKKIPLDLFFYSEILNISDFRLEEFLLNFEKILYISDTFDLEMNFLANQIVGFTDEEFSFLIKNSNEYFELKILYGLSFDLLKKYLLIENDKLKIIINFYSIFKRIISDKHIPFEQLVKNDPSVITYFLIQYPDLIKKFQSDSQLWTRLNKMNYKMLTSYHEISMQNLMKFLQENIYIENDRQNSRINLRVMAFHLSASSLQLKDEEAKNPFSRLEGIDPGVLLYIINDLLNTIREDDQYSSEELMRINKLSMVLENCFLLNGYYDFLYDTKSAALKDLHTLYFVNQFKVYQNSNTEEEDDFGMIFKGGWATHDLTYGIKKDGQKKFTFTIWNTGRGIFKYHPHIMLNNEMLSQTAISWSGFDASQIVDPYFVKKIFSLTHEPYSVNDNIYTFIERVAGKKCDAASKNMSDYHHPQKYGTCVWKSLWAAIQTLLNDPILTAKLKADLTSQFIEIYFKPNLENTKIDRILSNFLDRIKKKRISKASELVVKEISSRDIPKKNYNLRKRITCEIPEKNPPAKRRKHS